MLTLENQGLMIGDQKVPLHRCSSNRKNALTKIKLQRCNGATASETIVWLLDICLSGGERY